MARVQHSSLDKGHNGGHDALSHSIVTFCRASPAYGGEMINRMVLVFSTVILDSYPQIRSLGYHNKRERKVEMRYHFFLLFVIILALLHIDYHHSFYHHTSDY